jgi:site-specific DNA-methyltransferase (adenine-specific)
MELNRIHNCTAIDLFNSLQEKASLIVADPPYGIGYHDTQMGKTPTMKRGAYLERDKPRDHQPEQFDDSKIDTSWIKPAFESLAEGGAMYMFTRWDVMHEWHTAALEAGFKVPQCIVWDKCHFGAGNLDYYGSQTEFILFCIKGKHVLRWSKREGNMWRIGRGRVTGKDGGGRHPTQKPRDIFKQIIVRSSVTGDLVIDPFSGSGAACKAAQALGRRFIGCDIMPKFAAAAQAWANEPYTSALF